MRIQVIMAALIAGVLTGQCETYYVATSGNDGDTGVGDWTHALATISNGVARATTLNDIVLVSNGTYTLFDRIVVTNTITLRSYHDGYVDFTNTIINANGPVTLNMGLYLSNANALVEGFTITNGFVTGYGGGTYIAKGTMASCRLKGNTAKYGGGAYVTAGTLTNCIIEGNFATNSGGGIYGDNGSIIRNCQVFNNQVNSNAPGEGGGGIRFYNADINAVMKAEDCSIYGNRYYGTGNGGGGVNTLGAFATTLRRCGISNNYSATSGGGIHVWGGFVYDCQILNNTSVVSGGGARSYANEGSFGSHTIFSNCTISGNTANPNFTDIACSGGGISISDGGLVINCLIQSNRIYSMNSPDWGGGGGVGLGGGYSTMIISSTIANNRNSTGYGGGLYMGYGAVMKNCLIYGNIVGKNGGGVFAKASSPAGDGTMMVIDACTIVNGSSDRGGGLGIKGTNFSVANCVIYANTNLNASYPQEMDIYASSIATNYTASCTSITNGIAGTGLITNDPSFAEAGTGNWRLARGSPCINKGVNASWMINAVDRDGSRRVDFFSGQVDMGCYEYMPAGTLINVN